ncbi:MAG: hypothetical protein NTU76_04775 [Candidatus Taylorbacteria bacterium]|nr:hypothetical protein [Candidatus Taylorbacteria bacterium]
MSGFLRVLRFCQGTNPKTKEPQLQCFLGNRDGGTLYVVDKTSPVVPEIDKWFVCEEGHELYVSPDERRNIVTVLVHGEVLINADHGIFNLNTHKGVTQWQCHGAIDINSDWSMRVILVADNKGKEPKLPNQPGESWFFEVKYPITVGPDYVIMMVELTRQNISERALRRRNGEKGNHSSRAA